jgi:hypothetical protein
MSCTICAHPERQAIDQALVAGSATLAALSQAHGLSTSALQRHKAHLQAKVGRAKAQLQDNLLQGCLFWLSQALEISMQTAQAAQAEGDGKLVLKALAQGTRLISLMFKHELPLDDRLVYDILNSPQWSAQSALLPHDPNIMAKSRQSLAGVFSQPCPEDAPHCAITENRKLQIANRHFKSGKLAGKNPPKADKNLKNQEDKILQKIAGIDLASLLNSPVGADSPLTALFQPGADENIPLDLPLAEFIYEKSLQAGGNGNNPVRAVASSPGRSAAGAVATKT